MSEYLFVDANGNARDNVNASADSHTLIVRREQEQEPREASTRKPQSIKVRSNKAYLYSIFI